MNSLDTGFVIFIGMIFTSSAIGYLSSTAFGCLTFGLLMLGVGFISYIKNL